MKMKRNSTKRHKVFQENLVFLTNTLKKAGIISEQQPGWKKKEASVVEFEKPRRACDKCISQYQAGKSQCNYCRYELTLKPIEPEKVAE